VGPGAGLDRCGKSRPTWIQVVYVPSIKAREGGGDIASRAAAIPVEKSAHGTYRIGGSVGLTVRMDFWGGGGGGGGGEYSPTGKRILGCPSGSLVTILTELSRLYSQYLARP
jgi:hypothetical protein